MKKIRLILKYFKSKRNSISDSYQVGDMDGGHKIERFGSFTLGWVWGSAPNYNSLPSESELDGEMGLLCLRRPR